MSSQYTTSSNSQMATQQAQSHIGFGPNTSSSYNSPNLTGLVCNVHQTTGQCPPPFAGASHTVIGDQMYLFGGRLINRSRAELSNDIYVFDMMHRHWTKLEVNGELPPPRYFHSMCALGETKLVCYGGMSIKPSIPNLRRTHTRSSEALYLQATREPQQRQQQQGTVDDDENVTTLSDVYIFDTVTKTWTYVPAENPPLSRYAHCATITPSTRFFSSSSFHNSLRQLEPDVNGRKIATPGTIDGTGGAEMIIIGGQDRANKYIDQIAIFNLRSLTWTTAAPFPMTFGAYRGSMFPLRDMRADEIGAGQKQEAAGEATVTESDTSADSTGTPIVMYANYNFMDPRLEMCIRLPNGQTIEKEIQTGQDIPPGLRFPFAEQLHDYLVLGGVNYSSTEQEYSLYALNLRTLSWGRIDAGGTVLSRGSWNSGFLWPRRNKYIVFGDRNRSMETDYRARRVNYGSICMVELESFGLYDNPRRREPAASHHVSASAPALPAQLMPKFRKMSAAGAGGGGRPYASAAVELGKLALSLNEVADMELISIEGERIPVNSHLLARRWGPYFIRLLREATSVNRNQALAAAVLQSRHKQASDALGGQDPDEIANNRMSTMTITPTQTPTIQSGKRMSTYSAASTLVSQGSQSSQLSNTTPSLNRGGSFQSSQPTAISKIASSSLEIPSSQNLIPTNRPRMLYLPHTYNTIKLLVHFLYTSSLPPITDEQCSPQAFCSLLQLARPYQVDGLLEATVERLHEVLDSRNAAAVFNAAAMAAGCGRGTGFQSLFDATSDQDEELAQIAAKVNSEHINGTASRPPVPEPARPQPHRRPSAAFSTYSEANTVQQQHPPPVSSNVAGPPPILRHQSSNLSSTKSRSRTRRPSEFEISLESGNRHRAGSVSSNVTANSATVAPFNIRAEIDEMPRNGSLATTSSSSLRAGFNSRPTSDTANAEIWSCGLSPVVGLQKRGLRGLMEVRHMRRVRGVSVHHQQHSSNYSDMPPPPASNSGYGIRNTSSASILTARRDGVGPVI
ncbi:Kelch repeat containing protein [Ascosphaera apis ARSEF 7405]|uniref:Kelch repeat containing protein n=1 Tax=Ascosphaera apis ARSEF 7405 TaxID=392613 RepID=A0A162IJQ1_9EURO|nr:Kelch repeat containing protein [Ascosphaera apis ARSEF 7405]